MLVVGTAVLMTFTAIIIYGEITEKIKGHSGTR